MTYFEFSIKFKLLLALSKQLNINNLIMYISKNKRDYWSFFWPFDCLLISSRPI